MEIRTGSEFDSGSTRLAFIDEFTSARIVEKLDGGHEFGIVAPAAAAWLAYATARRVIRVAPENVTVSEWLVARLSDGIGSGGAEVTVACDPIEAILSDVGMIESVTSGGLTRTNLGGVNLSPRNYLATFVIPTLARFGIDWVEIGTMNFTDQFDLSFDGITPAALWKRVADEVGGEKRFRRGTSGYLLDILTELGSDLEECDVEEAKNVLQLVRERGRETLYTVIRPVGDLPSGGVERADIGMNAWRVTGIAAGVLTLASASGGLGPVLEDDQHVGLYIEDEAGDFHEIVATTAPNLVEVDDATGISEGEDVSIVADSSGTLLTEVRSPSGIALYGRVQGQLTRKMRGERFYLKNPALESWPAPWIDCGVGFTAGAPASTDVDVDGFPASWTIPIGSTVTFGTILRTTTSEVTTNGSGEVTIPVDGTTPSVGDNAAVRVFRAYNYPDDAEDDGGVSATYRSDLFTSGNLAGAADGSQTFTTHGYLNVKGLTEGDALWPGDILVFSGAPKFVCVGEATADSAGDATVAVMVPIGSTGIISDDDALDIIRPIPASPVGGNNALVFIGGRPAAASHVQTPNIGIRSLADLSKVWARAWFACINATTGTQTGLPSGGADAVHLDVHTVGLGEVASADFAFADNEMDSLEVVQGVLTAEWEIDEGHHEAWLEFFPLKVNNQGRRNVTILLGWSMHLGPDPDAPLIVGSHATRLFQAGQMALLAHRQWPATYVCTAQELVDEWGIDPNSPALGLGGTMRLKSATLGIDLLLRVVEVGYSPLDPAVKQLTLDTSPTLLTRQVNRTRARPLFVDLTVEVDADGRAEKVVLASEDPPPSPGVERAFVAPGVVAPITDDPVASVIL